MPHNIEQRPAILAMLDRLLEVAQKTVEGEPTILHVALPTGYGKSTASLRMADILRGGISEWKELNDYAERVIHIVPTRYLVEQLVERARNQNIKAYGQAMFLDPTLRSPFFISRLIFTTIDSYVLNFFKIPVEEIKLIAMGYSRGHFDTPRYAIMSAINVFDEYHLLTPGDSAIKEIGPYMNRAWTTFQVMLYQLSTNYKCPVILETATPRQQGILNSSHNIKILNVGLTLTRTNEQEDKGLVYDECFQQKLLEAKYRTKLIEEKFVNAVSREVRNLERPALIACNTIEEALEVYNRLRDTGEEVILLHSQFTLMDRIRKIKSLEEKVNKKSNFILIATQVIEVGVDLDFASLITNAAPLASLAQRIGRVNRKLNPGTHDVIIVYDEDLLNEKSYSSVYDANLVCKTIKKIKENIEKVDENSIGWRMTLFETKVNNVITLTGLSNCIYDKFRIEIDYNWKILLENLLSIFIESEKAFNLIERYGSFIREDIIAPLYILEEGPEEGPIEFEINRLVPCNASKLGLRQYNTDLERVKETLIFKDGKVLTIIEDKNGYRKIWIDLQKIIKGLTLGVISITEDGEKKVFLHALCGNSDRYDSKRGFLI